MYLKQANERSERRLVSAETAAALAALAGRAPFPAADYRFAWRELLRNHPHDSICGCSVDEVHDDMMERYTRLERTISVLERKAIAPLPLDARQARELYRPPARSEATLVNPLPWRRRRLVGEKVVELDGFASATVSLSRPARTPGRKRAIENEHYRVEAAPNGTLTVVELATGARHRGLHRVEDEPDRGDLYNFCPVEGAAVWRGDAKGVARSVRVLRAGPVVSELELRVERVRTVVRLVAGIDRIEFETEVDNRTRDHRLRVVFPVPNAGETVRAESQFAVVERPLVREPPRVEWKEPPDATQHALGAVALGDLALFTKGLPEYEARPDPPELALTLLRCVGALSRSELSTRPGGAGPRIATPGGQCLGRHRFEYAIRFGRLDETELVRAAHDYRFDFLSGPAGFGSQPPLGLEGDSVAFSCLKGAEDGDGVILRLYNPGRSAARVRVAGPFAAARCRLDETEERPLSRPTVELRPGEIVTLRLRHASEPEGDAGNNSVSISACRA
jgi:alpha-mannosidase